jgi:uncharacterized protein (TIGR02145 family)
MIIRPYIFLLLFQSFSYLCKNRKQPTMKTTLKLTALLLTFAVTFSSCKKEDPPETNTKIEKTKPWETSLGTASFATDTIWTIVSADGKIKQEWSDAVQTDFCGNKTTFDGGAWNSETQTEAYNIDCRSNPNHKGNLFSWRAVAETEHICPAGWRVPDSADFRKLNVALSGQDVGLGNYFTDRTIRDEYLTTWGGVYCGLCYWDGSLVNQGLVAFYWSQSEFNASNGFFMYFGTDGNIHPQNWLNKYFGYSLRCVR